MEEKRQEADTLKLGNELTIRRYLFNKMQVNQVLSVPDYIALHIIKETESKEDIYAGKTYLKDLAEKMKLSIRQTSKLVGKLKDSGLVVWSHDGNGSEGTYVTITESGRTLLREQEEAMKRYYGKVFDKFGKENLIQLLQLMKQLETIMSSEIESLEVDADGCGTDEFGADE